MKFYEKSLKLNKLKMDSILALPGWHDIKEVVLHHLNAKDRREAVLACKDFHNTICHLERNKCLKLDYRVNDPTDNFLTDERRNGRFHDEH